MFTLTAIFKKPEDTEAFDKHYNEVHTPLAQKMDGLRKIEVTRVKKMITPATTTIAEQPYMIVKLYFDSKDALNASMASESGKAAADDLMSFAGPLVSMLLGEETELSAASPTATVTPIL